MREFMKVYEFVVWVVYNFSYFIFFLDLGKINNKWLNKRKKMNK